MTPTNYRDDILPQDSAEDDSSLETATSQPLSEAEIEDLLYGEGRSTEERLRLLRTLRDDVAEREGYDVGDDDPEALVGEIDARIAELEGESGGIVRDSDPLAHRETLSPDSDELEELQEDDEESRDEEDDWLDAEDEEAGAQDAISEDFEDGDEDDEGDIDNDDDVAR